MMTLELGLIRTWRFPRFSALTMLFRQSRSTLIRTIFTNCKDCGGLGLSLKPLAKIATEKRTSYMPTILNTAIEMISIYNTREREDFDVALQPARYRTVSIYNLQGFTCDNTGSYEQLCSKSIDNEVSPSSACWDRKRMLPVKPSMRKHLSTVSTFRA